MRINHGKHLLFMANRVIGPAFAVGGFTIGAYFLLTEAIPVARDIATNGFDNSQGLVAAKVLLPLIMGWFGLLFMRVRRLGLGDDDAGEN